MGEKEWKKLKKLGKINEKSAFIKGKSEKVGEKYDFQKKGGGRKNDFQPKYIEVIQN